MKQQQRRLELFAYAKDSPTTYVDPSGLLERTLVDGSVSEGDFGTFTVQWSFALNATYDDEIILIQRISVNISLGACGDHSKNFRPRRCKFTYFEETGRLAAKATSVSDIDTWASTGFPSVFFRLHAGYPGAGENRLTCGTLTMRGQVRALKLNDTIKELVDTWQPGRTYVDDREECYGLTWTAGGFPSNKEFAHFNTKKWLAEEEKKPKTVVATWRCPPNQKTQLDLGESRS